jgi:hypothetical protein
VREVQPRRHRRRNLRQKDVHRLAVEVDLVEVLAHAVLFKGEHLVRARVAAAVLFWRAEVVRQT